MLAQAPGHDRLLWVHDLLSPSVVAASHPEEIAQKPRNSLSEAVKQLPDDELRAVDIMAFSGCDFCIR
jgi:hypothetical protein